MSRKISFYFHLSKKRKPKFLKGEDGSIGDISSQKIHKSRCDLITSVISQLHDLRLSSFLMSPHQIFGLVKTNSNFGFHSVTNSNSQTLNMTRKDSMRLDETRWDWMRIDETGWDSMRLNETRWDLIKLYKTRQDTTRLIETQLQLDETYKLLRFTKSWEWRYLKIWKTKARKYRVSFFASLVNLAVDRWRRSAKTLCFAKLFTFLLNGHPVNG